MNRCKGTGCTDAHSKHYCRLCQNPDSNHFARNCPTGITLYHGTRISSVGPISASGLLASTGGRLGSGIYLTTKEEAFKIAKNRNSGTGLAVFVCTVNLQSCHDNGNSDDFGGSWQTSYNSCTSMHPPWASNPAFREWCLKDPTRLRISGLYLVDGVIEGDLNLPRCDIFIGGNCTFKGNFKAGTINIGF